MVRAAPWASNGRRPAPLLLVPVLALWLLTGFVEAQDHRLEIGVGEQIVVDAWNPLRLIANDVPPGSVLTVTIDQGSLRSGPIPAVLTLPVSGGGGVSVVEERLYVPRFQNITWSLANDARVIGSGSVSNRDQDARPLDLVLSREPGRYASAFASDARVIDLTASQLPLTPDAYDGVRSLIIDGTATAPRLEAVAAAATGGVIVVLHGQLPSSHRELELLKDGRLTRLGAGAVAETSGAPVDAVSAVQAFDAPDREELLAALTASPLVEPPTPAPLPLVLAVAAGFSLVVIALLRLFAAPGLVSAVLLAALLSFAGWRALRPAEAELVGRRTLALGGGALALSLETREYFTLPAAVIDVPGGARPLRAQPYSLDRAGLHVALPRWRSLLVALAPTVVEFPVRLSDQRLTNAGDAPLSEVVVLGLGPQGELSPRGSAPLAMAEQGPLPELYAGLWDALPAGSLLATSGCPEACTVWLAPGFVDLAALEPDPDLPRDSL